MCFDQRASFLKHILLARLFHETRDVIAKHPKNGGKYDTNPNARRRGTELLSKLKWKREGNGLNLPGRRIQLFITQRRKANSRGV